MRAPATCPVCGEDVPRGAKSCPGCGSDHATGWSDHAQAQALDLPEDEFNYDEFVEREFSNKPKRRSLHLLWWVTAVLLLVLFALFLFRR